MTASPFRFQKSVSWVVYSILLLFLLCVLFLGYSRKINLTTADLGRHLKNGEIFFTEGRIVDTNHYSYTQPDRPVINHHWAAGVIFYWIQQKAGFSGLSLFYWLVLFAAFLLVFDCARSFADFPLVYFLAVLAVPLITFRAEIRPEGFSYLFLGFYLNLLYRYKCGTWPAVWLWAIPAVQLLWVNIHGFFVFGLIVIGIFLLDAVICGDKDRRRRLAAIAAACVLACLANPFGWRGMIYPFIFKQDLVYPVMENGSVLAMQSRYFDLRFLHFEVLCLFLAAGIGAVWIMQPKRRSSLFIPVSILLIFSVFAASVVRGLAAFGYLLIPAAAVIGGKTLKNQAPRRGRLVKVALLSLSALILLVSATSRSFYYSPYRIGAASTMVPEGAGGSWFVQTLKNFRSLPGLLPGVNDAAVFFKDNGLKGPIFNNFDIGGYLIYYLFPQERVFVDNRPEAYSKEFFRETYALMQVHDKIWRLMDERYQFNVIFFQHQERSPWTRGFLERRIKDPAWAPVFVDPYAIILLKRTAQNEPLIRRYPISVDTGGANGQ